MEHGQPYSQNQFQRSNLFKNTPSGGYTLFQEESIPTGIDSKIWNQILESVPKFKFV